MGVEGVMTVVPQGIIGTEANPGPEAWSPRFLPRCEAEANLGPFAGGCRAIEIRCGHPALPAAQGPGVGSDRWCIPMMTCRKSPETATGRAGSSSPLDGDDNGDREDSREQKTPRLVVPCLSVWSGGLPLLVSCPVFSPGIRWCREILQQVLWPLLHGSRASV